jgi:MFS family permease
MMASLSSRFYQFTLSQGICSPIGASMILYPCFSIVATWFKNRRALAMGSVASGSSLGGVLLPILVERVMGRIGFAWIMRICAFVMLGLLIVVNLTVRSRLPPQPQPSSFGTYLRLFKEEAFLLTALTSFFYSMGMFIPITFMVTYGEHMGMETGLAGYLVPIFMQPGKFP